MTHAEEHERLLERILVGELDEHGSEAVRLLGECPTCRADLARLRSLDQRLVAEAHRQREVVGLARAAADARDAELVRGTLDAAFPARLRRVARWRTLLAVAAALLLLIAWFAWRHPPGAEGEVLLGNGGKIEAAPDYASFDWEGPDGAIFYVSVWSVVDGQAGVRLSEVEVRDSRWSPEPERTRAWPGQIFLEYRSEDGNYSGSAIVSR